ncbi:unnamed protein product [Soboliphyme baturini]|uniref:Uncharacterized protein n=1 Tax=Soboliphyme baturini TaxID=241478 RepID=A0A183IL61_9BILA|nr:unnamed protein product [Soboliphyme baturini]
MTHSFSICVNNGGKDGNTEIRLPQNRCEGSSETRRRGKDTTKRWSGRTNERASDGDGDDDEEIVDQLLKRTNVCMTQQPLADRTYATTLS